MNSFCLEPENDINFFLMGKIKRMIGVLIQSHLFTYSTGKRHVEQC